MLTRYSRRLRLWTWLVMVMPGLSQSRSGLLKMFVTRDNIVTGSVLVLYSPWCSRTQPDKLKRRGGSHPRLTVRWTEKIPILNLMYIVSPQPHPGQRHQDPVWQGGGRRGSPEQLQQVISFFSRLSTFKCILLDIIHFILSSPELVKSQLAKFLNRYLKARLI